MTCPRYSLPIFSRHYPNGYWPGPKGGTGGKTFDSAGGEIELRPSGDYGKGEGMGLAGNSGARVAAKGANEGGPLSGEAAAVADLIWLTRPHS